MGACLICCREQKSDLEINMNHPKELEQSENLYIPEIRELQFDDIQSE